MQTFCPSLSDSATARHRCCCTRFGQRGEAAALPAPGLGSAGALPPSLVGEAKFVRAMRSYDARLPWVGSMGSNILSGITCSRTAFAAWSQPIAFRRQEVMLQAVGWLFPLGTLWRLRVLASHIKYVSLEMSRFWVRGQSCARRLLQGSR